jgi:hypothetical protein
MQAKRQKHTTRVLVARVSAYVWQSGRDAQFSLTYGRMYLAVQECIIYYFAKLEGSWCGRFHGLGTFCSLRFTTLDVPDHHSHQDYTSELCQEGRWPPTWTRNVL